MTVTEKETINPKVTTEGDHNSESPSPPQQKSASGKTPVSLLQELFVRKGITPKYDLIQIEGAVHEPTFKYRVTVGNFVATGVGQSKKKAKHSAAKTVLEQLRAAQEVAPPELLKDQHQLPETEILSPYDDGIPGNPVGELQELCMNRRMQPPTYEVSREEGQPHERSFVIVCLVGNKFRESGSGKSKKLAKRQAAHKMLTKLKELPAESANDEVYNQIVVDDDELAQGIAQRNSALKDLSARSSVQIPFKFYKNLRVTIGSKLASLQKLDNLVEGDHDETCIKLLDEISKEQDFKVTYVEIEERAKNGEYHCLIQLSTTPVAVCYGSAKSEKDAKIAASYNALEYLRILTK